MARLFFLAGLLPLAAIARADDCAADLEDAHPVRFEERATEDLDRRDLEKIRRTVERKFKLAVPYAGEPDLLRLVCQGNGERRFLVSFMIHQNPNGAVEILIDAAKPLTREAEIRFWKASVRGQRLHRVRWPEGSHAEIGGRWAAGVRIEAWRRREFAVMNEITLATIDGIVSHLRFPVRVGDHEFAETIRFGDQTFAVRLLERHGQFYLTELEGEPPPYLHRRTNPALSERMTRP